MFWSTEAAVRGGINTCLCDGFCLIWLLSFGKNKCALSIWWVISFLLWITLKIVGNLFDINFYCSFSEQFHISKVWPLIQERRPLWSNATFETLESSWVQYLPESDTILLWLLVKADLSHTVQSLRVAIMDAEVKVSLWGEGERWMPQHLAVQLSVWLHCACGEGETISQHLLSQLIWMYFWSESFSVTWSRSNREEDASFCDYRLPCELSRVVTLVFKSNWTPVSWLGKQIWSRAKHQQSGGQLQRHWDHLGLDLDLTWVFLVHRVWNRSGENKSACLDNWLQKVKRVYMVEHMNTHLQLTRPVFQRRWRKVTDYPSYLDI